MRFRLAALAAAVAVVITGCHSEPTGIDGPSAATDAAATLLHLADSLSTHGGTPTEVAAYRGLASVLVGTGRLSSVRISVDGETSEYLATAQEVQIGGCPAGAYCVAIYAPPSPDRSVIAWQVNNPRRVVQLFAPGRTYLYATADTGHAGAPLFPPTVMFMDGSGALYGGSASSQAIGVTSSSTPCAANPNVDLLRVNFTCTQADFTVAFDATTSLIPLDLLMTGDSIVATTSSSAPSHRLAMASQPVRGAHLDVPLMCAACPPGEPGAPPPVTTPLRDSLSATLTATVGTDVTFTFTVKNTKGPSVDVHFNDAQQYDFRVWNEKNVQVWHWAADKGFAQMLTTRTLAPGESVSYVEHWPTPAAGTYHAMAYLTSSSHAAVAFTTLSAP